ncbi:hypothetical protein APASM_3341 [Actinosynnema pretiosum subsp. pretiosum]|nr:hypothetical protein APASM_3341 [Actinosynnema pretiosum subsp. pretiosum]
MDVEAKRGNVFEPARLGEAGQQEGVRLPRWGNRGPDGPPLTRVRDAGTQRDNRKRPKAECRRANPGGWD